MFEENWMNKITSLLESVHLNENVMANMKTLEWFVEGGKSRVLACVIKSGKRGIRYSELLKITKLPNTNLSRILNELRAKEIIYQENVRVTEPREERVPVYFYNKNKFGSLIVSIIESLMTISRDDIELFKRKINRKV